MESLTPQDIPTGGGLRVALISDTSQVGVVLKRQGPRVRVDFSQTGGKGSKWHLAQELCRAPGGSESQAAQPLAPASAPSPPPAPAAALAPAPAPASSKTAEGTYVCKRKSVIRAGFEMDSEKAGVLGKGEIITALEMRLNAQGV
eukprot:COSAG01_NODE_27286_length_689_cov_1.415254_1_plen_144_part_10